MVASRGSYATRQPQVNGHGSDSAATTDISGALARKKATELRHSIRNGIDPQTQRRATEADKEAIHARLFSTVAEDWLVHKTQRWLSSGTLNQVRTYLDKDILPILGSKSVDTITRTDCLALQARIESRGAHNIAEKIRSWINQIFGHAIALGLTENDPATRLKAVAARAPATRHQPHLLEPELPDFLKALKSSPSRLTARTAAWLCLWTTSRPGMVRWAEWTEIDLQGAVWTIPASKMKTRRDHVCPLPSRLYSSHQRKPYRNCISLQAVVGGYSPA